MQYGSQAALDAQQRQWHEQRPFEPALPFVIVLMCLCLCAMQSDIVRVRDRLQQLDMGVPESALDGHAFHTYRLTSPDGSVSFVFKHNVVGRSIYAQVRNCLLARASYCMH